MTWHDNHSLSSQHHLTADSHHSNCAADSDSVSDGTKRRCALTCWACLPTSHPISPPTSSPSLWLCKHVKSSKTYPSLTPGRTVFTLDDNQKFDYGIFIVHLCEHSNRLSLSISASKAGWHNCLECDCSRAAERKTNTKAPRMWSVNCVN